MSEARWTLFSVAISQRRYGTILGPSVGLLATGLISGLLSFSTIGRVADPVDALLWVVGVQIVASLAVASYASARFAKYRLTPENWTLLSLTGSGPRLARAFWGPSQCDALATFALTIPVVCFWAILFSVDRWQLGVIELAGLGVLVTTLLVEMMWSFLGLRGKAGNLIARQLRWIIPFTYLTFGRFFTGNLLGVLPTAGTTASSWTQILLTVWAIAIVAVALGIWFGKVFLNVAGEGFGYLHGGVQLKEIELPKLYRGKTTRSSKPLRTRHPVLEREMRTILFGVVGWVWLSFTLLIIVAMLAEQWDWLNAMIVRWRMKGFWEVAQWAGISLLWIAGVVIAPTTPTARFDAESKEQTITSLVMAVHAKRFVWSVLGVTLTATLLIHLTAATFALLASDAGPGGMTPLIVAIVTGSALAVSCYLCLIGATLRLRYTKWYSQFGYLLFAVILAPLAIFVSPFLLAEGIQRVEANPEHLEAGMSRKVKGAE